MPPTLVFPLTTVSGQPPPTRRFAEVPLEIRTRAGTWVEVRFRLDTGANASALSNAFAAPPTATNPNGLNLEISNPGPVRPVTTRYADGRSDIRRMYPGTLTVRFPELPAFVFRWMWLFDGVSPADAARLLGIGGSVLDDIHITFRGGSPDYLEGSVVFDFQPPFSSRPGSFSRPVPLFPPSDPLARECRYETREPIPPASP